MNKKEKTALLRQLCWDYHIPPEEMEAVLAGKKERAGHFTREKLFIRLLETYPWFTILQLLPVEEIRQLLSNRVISSLRSPDLRKKYAFVRQRLQQIIPTAG